MIKNYCDFCGEEIAEHAYGKTKTTYKTFLEDPETEYILCGTCIYEVMNLIENKRIEKQEVKNV